MPLRESNEERVARMSREANRAKWAVRCRKDDYVSEPFVDKSEASRLLERWNALGWCNPRHHKIVRLDRYGRVVRDVS